MANPLCIYHGNCVDGFGAAWVVRRALGDGVEFHPGVYGIDPPDVTGRDVVMVDFSYKRPVLQAMALQARSMLILDHHKTAQEDLAELAPALKNWSNHLADVAVQEAQGHIEGKLPIARAVFDMERSGAGLAWDYFFPDIVRPQLIDSIEDRDLWRFALPGTREINACIFSHPYDFDIYDNLYEATKSNAGLDRLKSEGSAIDRKMLKDIGELLGVASRVMKIGGVHVPVVNAPKFMASEAAGKLAESAPFAAAYFDRSDFREFSLRSRGPDGADVSEIAKRYGGGGHRNAAGFQMPIGWEGDA